MESSKSQMRRCDTPDELVSALKSASRDKSKASVQMLVEDYLEISHEYSILGLSTKQGVVAPGFFIAEQGGHKERRGVAMTGRIIPFGERAGLIKQMADFVAGLGYEGLFDIDLIETADGTMYFTELNLRYGASGYAVTESGANLPGMFADYMLLDKPIDLSCSLEKTGKLFTEVLFG